MGDASVGLGNQYPSEGESGLVPFSRRAFFALTAAVGSLTFLGSAQGGRILAFADEEGNVSFTIYILRKDEVPIMAYDLAGGKATPLANVRVRITSLLSSVPEADRTIEVRTDDQGFAPACIRKMSYQRDDDASKVYNFWGSIEASVEIGDASDGATDSVKYREFAVHDYFIEAGTPTAEDGSRPNVINIPTQPVGGEAYLRQLTFDGEDVQYAQGVEAPVFSANDLDHDLVAEIVTPVGDSSVTCKALIDGAQVVELTQTSGADGHTTFTFTRAWCQDTLVGATLSLSWTCAGVTSTFESPLAFVDPIVPDSSNPTDVLGENVPLSLGLGGGEGSSSDQVTKYKKIPGWLSRVGESLNIAFPCFPVELFFDVKGRFGVAVTLLKVDFLKRHNGEDVRPGKEIACSVTGVSENKAWAGFKARLKESRENLNSSFGPVDNPKICGCAKPVTDLNMSLAVDLIGMGTAEGVKSGTTDRILYTGDLVPRLTFLVAGSYTRQMQAAWVPFFVTFDMSLRTTAEFATGIKFYGKFHDLDFHYAGDKSKGDNYNVIIILRLEAGITLGLGVHGVVSGAVRGFAYIHWEFTFPCPAQLPSGKTNPHIVSKIGANVQAIIQVLFFKKTYQVTKFKPAIAWDNWEDNETSALSATDSADLLTDEEEIGYEDLLPSDIVTDGDLAGSDGESVEATGIWGVSNDAGEAAPSYDTFSNLAFDGNSIYTAPEVASPYLGTELYNAGVGAYNPVNGVIPITRELLYSSKYSNPRIRIVHTDTKTFTQDRAFMVRVAAVNIEVPQSTAAFASTFAAASAEATLAADDAHGRKAHGATSAAQPQDGTYQEEAFDLQLQEVAGNTFVEVTDQASSLADAQAQAALAAGEPQTVTRTRLTVCEWNQSRGTWDEGYVIDFSCPGEVSEVDRLNSYDIDFQVDYHDGGLYIAVNSFQRPKKAAPTYIDCEQRQYLSVVRYDVDRHRVAAAGSTFQQMDTGLSLFQPNILMQHFDAGRGAKEHCIVYSYAVQYADDGLSRKKTYLAATVFDDMREGLSGHQVCPPTILPCSALEKLTADELVQGKFEVSCPDPTKTMYDEQADRHCSTALIAWSHSRSKLLKETFSHLFLLSFNVKEGTANAMAAEGAADAKATTYTTILHEHVAEKLDNVPDVIKLGRMGQRSVFSYPAAPESSATSSEPSPAPRPLCVVTANLSTRELNTFEGGLTTDKTQYFPSFNGRRLYCVRTMDTTGLQAGKSDRDYEAFKDFGAPGVSQEAADLLGQAGTTLSTSDGPYNSPLDKASASTSNKPVSLFQLLEARWLDDLGTYSDFYPIAQLNYAPDNIGVIAASKQYTHFTLATLTSNYQTADIYQVDVPVVMAADLGRATPVNPFAASGDTCWYTCDIANFGNAPITAITMRVTLGDGTTFKDSVKTFDDLRGYMLTGPEDSQEVSPDDGASAFDELGIPQVEEVRDPVASAGILWPGHRRTFRFCFTVPEFAEEQKGKVTTFQVKIDAIEDRMDDALMRVDGTPIDTMTDPDGMPLFADDDYVLAEVDSAEVPTLLDPTEEEFEVTVDEETTEDASDVGTANYATGSSGDGDGGDGDGGSGSTTPKMGGQSLWALAAAAAAAGAAYGVKRYEERRAENEAAAGDAFAGGLSAARLSAADAAAPEAGRVLANADVTAATEAPASDAAALKVDMTKSDAIEGADK